MILINDHIRVIECLFIFFNYLFFVCLIMMDCNNKEGNFYNKKINEPNNYETFVVNHLIAKSYVPTVVRFAR